MEIAQQLTARRQAENVEVKNYDMSIMLGYSIFAILFLIVVYSVSSGTASGDFAAMTIFS